MVKAIVTGGLGFIGSHLVDELLRRGVYVLVIDDARSPSSPPSRAADANYQLIARSVQDTELYMWGDKKPVDYIYHLANYVGPVGILDHGGDITIDTLSSAQKVATWSKISGASLVDVSTSEVYGDPTRPNNEDSPTAIMPGAGARKEYAAAKIAAEKMLLNSNIDVKIIRPFNVAGPRQRPEGGFVLPRFVLQALTEQDITVYEEDSTPRRAFTHVKDIVNGLIRAAESGWSGRVFNLGNSDNAIGIFELAHEVRNAVSGTKSRIIKIDPVELYGPAYQSAPNKIPDMTTAYMNLGWLPVYGMDDIIKDTIDYWRSLDPLFWPAGFEQAGTTTGDAGHSR